jgi:hypothetical protein
MASPIHSSNSGEVQARNRPPAGAVAVGCFIAPAAGELLRRGGTVMAGLSAQWAAIAGPSLAAETMPAKLTTAAPEPGFHGKIGPSVLLLKVNPAKALEVQYAIPQLIERINQALGYKAIASVRLLQAPVEGAAKKRPLLPRAPHGCSSGDKADRLKNALARMAAGVGAKNSARA